MVKFHVHIGFNPTPKPNSILFYLRLIRSLFVLYPIYIITRVSMPCSDESKRVSGWCRERERGQAAGAAMGWYQWVEASIKKMNTPCHSQINLMLTENKISICRRGFSI